MLCVACCMFCLFLNAGCVKCVAPSIQHVGKNTLALLVPPTVSTDPSRPYLYEPFSTYSMPSAPQKARRMPMLIACCTADSPPLQVCSYSKRGFAVHSLRAKRLSCLGARWKFVQFNNSSIQQCSI